MPFSTSRLKVTSIDPYRKQEFLSKRTFSERIAFLRQVAFISESTPTETPSDLFTFRPTRFTALWEVAAFSPKQRRTALVRHIRQQKLHPTTWPEPGTTPTGCQSSFPTVQTTMGRFSFQKSLSP